MDFIAALRKVTESIRDWVEARVTSWNDLTDKPFGEGEPVKFVDNVSVTVSSNTEAVYDAFQFDMTADTTYVVIWDGVEYVCTSMEFFDGVVLGNAKYIGGQDTGEPFRIGCGNGSTELHGEVGEHTVTVTSEAPITPIDEKYLPEEYDAVFSLGDAGRAENVALDKLVMVKFDRDKIYNKIKELKPLKIIVTDNVVYGNYTYSVVYHPVQTLGRIEYVEDSNTENIWVIVSFVMRDNENDVPNNVRFTYFDDTNDFGYLSRFVPSGVIK